MTMKKKPFETIVGKGENDGNQQLLLLPQCFLPFLSIFESNLLSSANAFNLDQPKMLSFGKELTLYNTILIFKGLGKEAF